MFPKEWTEDRIKVEVDSAWNSSTKVINPNTGQWTAKTPSGVTVKGYTTPRITAFPEY